MTIPDHPSGRADDAPLADAVDAAGAAMRDVDAHAAGLMNGSTTVLCLASVMSTQLGSMGDQAADVAARANEIADRSREAADATARMRADVASALASVRALGDQAREIAAVSAALSRLALETRFVGLNAAIEAARAGEAGKGFAVVAEKVRELSDGASDAAARIVERLRAVRDAAVQSAGTMERLSETMGVIDGHASEIAEAAGGQRRGVADVADGIAQVTASVDEIVRVVEDITETGMKLGEDARAGLDAIEALRPAGVR